MTINSPLPGTARKGFFFGGAGGFVRMKRAPQGRVEERALRRAMQLVAVAGLCGGAEAVVNTRVDVLVSTDGVNFGPMAFLTPGATYQVLVSVSYIGTASPLGLASMVFQPTVSNFDPAGMTTPFVNGGAGSNTSNPPGV